MLTLFCHRVSNRNGHPAGEIGRAELGPQGNFWRFDPDRKLSETRGRRSPTKKKGPRCQLIRPTPKKVERHHLRLVFSIGRRIRCVEPTHSKRVENRMGAMADKPWRPCFLLYLLLEVDLRAKLQSTSIVGRGHLSKVSIGEAVIDVLELSVVEGIKGLKTQLKIRSLAGGEWDCLE